jgi:surface protein
MSFPPPITGLKLRVSTGTGTYEQSIPSASLGNNSMQIMPNTVVFNAFNTNPAGTIFTPSIVTSYGSDGLGNAVSAVSTPSVVANFVARKTTPNLSLAAFTNKSTIDSPFSLSVTTNSGGVLSYLSSDVGVATVDSSGRVTIVGAGTTTITVNLAASADGQFAAASVTQPLLVSLPVTAPAPSKGFSVLTDNSDFSGLDFDSGMTTLFTDADDVVHPITMPNSNFMFNSAAYTTLYLSSNAWLSFGTNVAEFRYGDDAQQPINTFRFFSGDHVSTGSYKFVSNNTRLLIKLTGMKLGADGTFFTIKLIITQSGEIRTNYTLASTFTSNRTIIGYVGGNSSATSDDIFLTLNGVTFNGTGYHNLFSLLNGKTILYIPERYPTFGTFTLPSDIQVYRNQTITRVLTPPTSNSSGAFTFISSNTAVATITVNNGVSSINVIGAGTTIITATQAASGGYDSSSVTASLTVTVVLPTFGPFTLPSDIQVYQNQTITRTLTPPTSNSSGGFTFSSSNTAVATISVNNGVSSINVIGPGTTTIIAVQALSGIYASSSVTASLTVTVVLPTFGPFSLPSHELIYQSQTITRPLTPPTSNSSGAFTITSTNTDVATISISGGVSSINVIGAGSTIITVTQAASGIYASSSIAVLLNTVTGTSFRTIWRQLGVDIDGEAPSDNSGRSVSLSSDGTTLAIGAVGNDGNGTDSGHVRVYTRDTSVALGWTQLGGDIDGEAPVDWSGYSVSLSSNGNILAVGAILNDGNGSDSGHVRVYTRDANKTTAVTDQKSSNFGPVGWTRLGADIEGEAAGDNSGVSVSLSSDGNTLAIGAPNNDGIGSSAGHVRVFIRDTTVALGWTQLGGDIDGEAPGDQSGWSVSLSSDGTTLAIGAPANDGNGSNAGHVRVYKYFQGTNTWVQQGGDIDGEAAADQSGISVSLSSDGNIVAIGAILNDGNGSNSGHVRVYTRDTNKTTAVTDQKSSNFGPVGWTRLGGDIDGVAAGDNSGNSVSLSSDGTTLAIGANLNDANGTDSGHVRVYKYNPSKLVAQLDQSLPGFGPARWDRIGADIDGEAAGDQSGRSVSLSSDGTTLAIGATGNDGTTGNTSDNRGHVRVYNINSPTFGPFTLPSDIQVYQNQTITRLLTPPTSDSSGAFTFISSNTAVATISISGGVSSINVIGGGTTTIRAIQAASGGYASFSVTASLTVIPMLSFADLPVKLTIDSPFSLSGFVTKNSTGVLSYESSAPSVATVNSSSGLVTLAGAGTTTITVSLSASADGQFAAASVTKTLVVLLPITRAANGVTIQYPLTSIDSEPRFIQANPRGTPQPEWFAVVTNASKAQITSYAKSGGSAYFTTSDPNDSQHVPQLVPFKNIITTLMTDMSELFYNATTFNADISSWDTSKVTTMYRMFANTTVFNNYGSEDIRYWNTSIVTNMNSMFSGTFAFNQPIGSWNTPKVTDMGQMFMYAKAFNQNIGSWDTSKVTNMNFMFYDATAFNNNGSPNIGYWDTSNVINMNNMFTFSSAFNQNIGNWNTSKVTNMGAMFYNATAFNNGGSSDIGNWNTSKVITMEVMFFGANKFNQNIGSWNTALVTSMRGMFQRATAFNNNGSSDIGNWNTAKVTNMSDMFNNAANFNQNIGSWNTALVTDMRFMFFSATIFNQNLSGWNVALTAARPTLARNDFATGSPLALAENSAKLPLFQ